SSISSTFKSLDDKAADDKPNDDTGSMTVEEPVNKEDQAYRDEFDRLMSQEMEASDASDAFRMEFEQGYMYQSGATQAGSTNSFNIISNLVNDAKTSRTFSTGRPSSPHPNAFIPTYTLLHVDQDDSQIPDLEDTTILKEADFNNMESSTVVSPIPIHRVHIDHPKNQILGDPKLAVQTKGMENKSSRAHAFMEPKKVSQALNDKSWVEAMFRVTPKLLHLHAVKRIFRRLISWQCKKQTIVATFTIEAEYLTAANYCEQNLVYHSKTKHIEVRHHFIRDLYEKKLIQVLKIHTDDNVVDLLIKAFDASRFNFLKANIGMLNV
nr:hypothetical protein [Tanacetum cinerariifolium]